MAVAEDDDPGWHVTWRIFVAWVPAVAMRQMRHPRPGQDGLVLLRQTFLAFVVMLVLLSNTALLVGVAGATSDMGVGLAVGLSVYGVFGVVAVPRIEPRLDCSGDERLAETYRTRFFLRMAFADAPALLGLVGYLETGSRSIYLIGAGFAILGLARAAPTAAHLRSEQAQLTANGCGRSLARALRGLTTPGI